MDRPGRLLGFVLVLAVSATAKAQSAASASQTEYADIVAEAAPRDQRALGYRWEENAWRLEPTAINR